MHAFRQSRAALGEVALVVGLGLIGQTLVRVLHAAGVRVLGIDPIAQRCTLALAGGAVVAEPPDDNTWRNTAARLTSGFGPDVVLITAAASDNALIEVAASVVRERGRIVVVGKSGLDLDYNTFFRKEIEVCFSRSYGPGRYDAAYENDGIDYPYPYVRWTEKRNIEAFIALLASRRIDVAPLVDLVRDFDQAVEVYDDIHDGNIHAIGILLDYGVDGPGEARPSQVIAADTIRGAKRATIGVLGAGNYASSMLLPPLKADHRAEIRTIVTTTGLSAASAAQRFGASVHGTNPTAVLDDADISGVVIATRHRSHASLTARALRAGKAVLVEKPLAIDAEGLALVDAAVRETGNDRLMVGFNRRFAPIIRDLAAMFVGKRPLTLLYRVHAGPLPPDAWQLASAEGGRFVGEAGHFFDLFQLLTASRPVCVSASRLAPTHAIADDHDNITVVVTYEDGSVGTLLYLTQGGPKLGKEYLEVHGAGESAVMHNFTTLETFGPGARVSKRGRYGGDKGQRAQMQTFVDLIANGTAPPTSYDHLADTTRLTWLALEAARSGEIRRMS
jgi:predicted dehydrogenase